MSSTVFIRRVRAKNFKSIAACDVELGPLTYLVGPNGSGKSNLLDALHFVRDALEGSLENALHLRGGLSEVRRRSGGHPTHFGVRLDFHLPDGRHGYYAFNVGSKPAGGFEVLREECAIGEAGMGPSYVVAQGKPEKTSEDVFPVSTPDRLALVNAAGLPAFRPVFDALVGMNFYNLNPRVMRDLQKPQDGATLKPVGENIASVVSFLERYAPRQKALVEEYLNLVVPSVHGVERIGVGHMETVEFRQDTAGSKHPWRFAANSMSDGTLRALGILVALFQGGDQSRPSLIGIEEPEVALHPAAAAVVREALSRASERSQVLVTSHSPDLLDDVNIGVDSLLAVSSEGGVTQIAPIDEGARKVMRDRLYTAGELLKLNQLSPDSDRFIDPETQQLKLFGVSV
ncbi:AAA family ATPase [Aquabacterium sp. A7-Y]|uniref:AAA family ATPase n=1 Tax=Aquabacterium sp. A7-Y TaxID=1349605 RepID=UPI00223CA661|nr:AAA family ATPase [Aquabacterium sp. A7-Y]MCW7537397.1 AAA family ATPase [Aquabacterium sp. A7-Y]